MDHLILTLGTLIAGAAIVAIVFRLLKQSSIIAFIAVGITAGCFSDRFHIPHELIEVFTEIGIILLLFMAGLEVEFSSIKKRWRLLILNGLGQIVIMTVLGAGLGSLLLDTSATSLIYFGLCLTFSSTIVVLGYLKAKKEMESFHGQIILGIMVLQDIAAVLALVILKSLGGDGSIMAAVGIILLKLLVIAGILFVLAKFILPRLFRYLATSQELIFIGSLGWALGVAALCELVEFSPEIGAFMAGAALSIVPYKLEIQDKVEPMKDFGVILFFLALGYGLKLDSSAISVILPTLCVAAFVLLGTPLVMTLIGYVARQKSRPTFMVGMIINQVSEFSLILAALGKQAGLFSDYMFLLIVLSTVATIFFSTLGQQFCHRLYAHFNGKLTFLDRRHRSIAEAEMEGFERKDHIVVIKYNELAEKVIAFYLDAGKRVLVIDIDPAVYAELKDRHQNLRCLYADAFDPDTRDDGCLAEAGAIISCMIDGQEAELGILNWLKRKGADVPFVAATDSYAEALELYDHGATYVIQTEDLAAQQFARLLEEYGGSLGALHVEGKRHQEEVLAQKNESVFRFA